MKIHELDRLSRPKRRALLKWLGLAGGVPAGLKYGLDELLLGKAYAQAQAAGAQPTFLIEMDLRDQWDPGHVFVAPGLATNPNLVKGTSGQMAALFYKADELKQHPNDVYLTADSAILAPHVDSIAFVDCCEVAKGSIHGHESANPMRSPGRTYTEKPGYMPMYANDPTTKFPGGNERYFSATPTPASLHNWVQKQATPGLRNGLVLKNISRSIHTVYHFAAGLAGGELDRIRSKASLFEAFPSVLPGGPPVFTSPLQSPAEAEAFRKVLEKLDKRFLTRRGYVDGAWTDHSSHLGEAQKQLYTPPLMPGGFSLTLTPEETTYWSADVPKQVGGRPQYQVWEAAAYATKLVTAGVTRSVAFEFDYVDVHGSRPESQMRTMGTQLALPLGRMIEQLKKAGIYDRTLICVFMADGGRPPAAGDSGDRGKNTVVLAGGMIKGGYYGDIRAMPAGSGNKYLYHAPDPVTGAPVPTGVSDNSARVPGAAIWRTIMRATKVPDSVAEKFPDTMGVKPLTYMLRG